MSEKILSELFIFNISSLEGFFSTTLSVELPFAIADRSNQEIEIRIIHSFGHTLTLGKIDYRDFKKLTYWSK